MPGLLKLFLSGMDLDGKEFDTVRETHCWRYFWGKKGKNQLVELKEAMLYTPRTSFVSPYA